MVDPNWLIAGGLWVTSVGGWVYTSVKNGRSHERDMGKLEGKVDGLELRMGSLEKGVGDIHGRIDSLITAVNDGTKRRE